MESVTRKHTLSPEGKMTINVRLNEINTIIHLKKYSVCPRILILYSNSYITENTITLYR